MDKHRSEQIIKIRPIIPMAKLKEGISEAERFQNTTLRPIIKLQNELLIDIFKNYLISRKLNISDLNIDKMTAVIEKSLTSDMKFKNKIQGIIIGHFTLDEYRIYKSQTSEFNKRITQMIKERLISNIDNM